MTWAPWELLFPAGAEHQGEVATGGLELLASDVVGPVLPQPWIVVRGGAEGEVISRAKMSLEKFSPQSSGNTADRAGSPDCARHSGYRHVYEPRTITMDL